MKTLILSIIALSAIALFTTSCNNSGPSGPRPAPAPIGGGGS